MFLQWCYHRQDRRWAQGGHIWTRGPASGSTCTHSSSSNNCNDSGGSCIRVAMAAAAAAATLSLPAVAVDKQAHKQAGMRVTKGKSGCGWVKMSVRTNEQREKGGHALHRGWAYMQHQWGLQQWQWQHHHMPNEHRQQPNQHDQAVGTSTSK